jgi:hypothetical protein
MADAKFSKEVLEYLWREYQKNSNLSYDISPLCAKSHVDPVRLSNELKQEGLVKDDVVVEGDKVSCCVSMKGVIRLDKQFVESKIDAVLGGLREVNSIGNVMEILNLGASDFQLAFDLANEMQNRDLVKLLYAFQPGNKVSVEMTLEGVRHRRPATGNR